MQSYNVPCFFLAPGSHAEGLVFDSSDTSRGLPIQVKVQYRIDYAHSKLSSSFGNHQQEFSIVVEQYRTAVPILVPVCTVRYQGGHRRWTDEFTTELIEGYQADSCMLTGTGTPHSTG